MNLEPLLSPSLDINWPQRLQGGSLVFVLRVIGRAGMAQGVCAVEDVGNTGTLKQEHKILCQPKLEV